VKSNSGTCPPVNVHKGETWEDVNVSMFTAVDYTGVATGWT
jgi:hypothetical protein